MRGSRLTHLSGELGSFRLVPLPVAIGLCLDERSLAPETGAGSHRFFRVKPIFFSAREIVRWLIGCGHNAAIAACVLFW